MFFRDFKVERFQTRKRIDNFSNFIFYFIVSLNLISFYTYIEEDSCQTIGIVLSRRKILGKVGKLESGNKILNCKYSQSA